MQYRVLGAGFALPSLLDISYNFPSDPTKLLNSDCSDSLIRD
jgi:hypothetical protein